MREGLRGDVMPCVRPQTSELTVSMDWESRPCAMYASNVMEAKGEESIELRHPTLVAIILLEFAMTWQPDPDEWHSASRDSSWLHEYRVLVCLHWGCNGAWQSWIIRMQRWKKPG